ncbi:hypothetical protein KCP75_15830 [Salmonella enterica subsp. enterica]|nr:hypothetical protein KCP75_15830 [Salmonella enterica subsp. enterica]
MRPAMYGSYHRISAGGGGWSTRLKWPVGRDGGRRALMSDVFTQQEGNETRALPAFIPTAITSYCTIPAYGASMSSNYMPECCLRPMDRRG